MPFEFRQKESEVNDAVEKDKKTKFKSLILIVGLIWAILCIFVFLGWLIFSLV